MLRRVLIKLAAIVFCMGLGALAALWQCSKRKWCPQYLKRQLDDWHKQMKKPNKRRHSNRTEQAAPADEDEEAERETTLEQDGAGGAA
jgi:hypothetical protein